MDFSSVTFLSPCFPLCFFLHAFLLCLVFLPLLWLNCSNSFFFSVTNWWVWLVGHFKGRDTCSGFWEEFDKVSYYMLVDTMEKYDLDGRTIGWAHSWLNSCAWRALIDVQMPNKQGGPGGACKNTWGSYYVQTVPRACLFRNFLFNAHLSILNLGSSFQSKPIRQ